MILLLVLPVDAGGVCSGCGMKERLTYHFFHANVFHALINVWALLVVVFYYDVALWKLLAAYAIAALVPSMILSDTPTVGLSGLCWALFGMISFNVVRRWYWQAWMAAFLALGMIIPNIHGLLHLYCYLAGLLVGVLDMPVKRKKNHEGR